MEVPIINEANEVKSSLEVSEHIFNTPYKEALVHQVITSYLTNARSGTKKQKNRADVRGGGRKPWRQKGTGRARAGTIRSPIWRGGGVTFAARPRNYSQKLNRKMYRAGMRCIFSELNRQGRLLTIETLKLSSPKTKELLSKLDHLGLKNVLILIENLDTNLELASRNLHSVFVTTPSSVSPVDLISFDKIIAIDSAIKNIEARLV